MINVNLKIIENTYENSNAIDNTIAYIYRLNKKSPLPIYCYGVDFPPTYENVIKSFHKTRDRHPSPPDQQVYHFIISLEFLLPNINFFYFADDVAKIFDCYPVCYSFHTDTDHPHFHFIVSTISYFPGYQDLDDSFLSMLIKQAQQMALKKHNMILDLK